jgi:hypothetical protein
VRTLLLLRETADVTPAQARLVTALRTGVAGEYFASKGHALYVLDDDTVGPDGKPLPQVEAWKQHVAGMQEPVLVIYDAATKQILDKWSVPEGATAAQVLERVKARGG